MMKISLYLFLSIAVTSYAASREMRTITDMAGRTVVIPAVVNSVYSTSPMGEIIMYTLAPHKITGRTWELDEKDKSFLLDEYIKKTVLGGWYGKNTTGNPEVIIKAHPDIVLSMGLLDKTDLSASQRISEKLGIPVVMLDGRLQSADTAYRFLGRITGDSIRADTLARYCRSIIDSVRSVSARIPEKDKVRLYYAEGLNGLETDSKGSMHTEVLEMAGAINVADIPLLQGYGRAAVSFEQLLLWQPHLILVCPDHGHPGGTGHYANLLSNPSWQALDAMKRGAVFEIPAIPFNCVDRPPSVNRILGLVWLSHLLYPHFFTTDLREAVTEFYQLFYHKNLTAAELDILLSHAVRPGGHNGKKNSE